MYLGVSQAHSLSLCASLDWKSLQKCKHGIEISILDARGYGRGKEFVRLTLLDCLFQIFQNLRYLVCYSLAASKTIVQGAHLLRVLQYSSILCPDPETTEVSVYVGRKSVSFIHASEDHTLSIEGFKTTSQKS